MRSKKLQQQLPWNSKMISAKIVKGWSHKSNFDQIWEIRIMVIFLKISWICHRSTKKNNKQKCDLCGGVDIFSNSKTITFHFIYRRCLYDILLWLATNYILPAPQDKVILNLLALTRAHTFRRKNLPIPRKAALWLRGLRYNGVGSWVTIWVHHWQITYLL